MSSPFKGITLHEGYNDIGSFEVNITNIEEASPAVSYAAVDFPPVSRKLLFRLQFESGKPVTQAYKGTFNVLGRAESENTEYIAYPNSDGYIEIDTPVFPVVPKPEEEEEPWLLRLSVNGPLNERAEESYIEVLDASSASVYTLIWDICVNDGYLAIRSEAGNYYSLATGIAVGSLIRAVHITATGKVFGFNVGTGGWSDLGTLEFNAIEFPENLDTVEDGFYRTTGTTGTVTTWEAGGTGFEDYSLSLLNPGVYLVNVEVNVTVEPTGNVFSGTFSNKMPGSLNYILVPVTGSVPATPDTSPTIEEIETLSGVTFSETFSDFLSSKDLTTLDRVRKAGPIIYINDYPTEGISNAELNTLQAHVNFYSINKNAEQNQIILSAGFKTILGIAYVQRKTFLDAVVDEEALPLFQAARIYELATQHQKLAGNLLPGLIADLRLEQPATPEVYGSNFVDTALGNVLNTCGCDDCKSVISPFAYLLDLLKYGAAHVKYSGSPAYNPGGNVGTFITLMSTKFLQPFGTLNIDCKTLHDEFCRVRLVSEVLEAVVAASSIPSARAAVLATERNQFFQLVYQTVLLQAGSSINEVRNVHLTQPAADKLIAAQKLSDKLGIPLYVPTTSDYTVDALWLTISNGNPNNVLNAGNLEHVFGFRNTQRNVLTDTPVSLMEDWHAAYLRDFWKTQDYLFTDYSREGLVAGNAGTYKANWLPIVDPDIMGWEDMTYLGSSAAKSLWNNRKEDTDTFLKYCVTDLGALNPITADLRSRILRVIDMDITSHVMEANSIIINDGSGDFSFIVNKRTLTGTDTDVSLAQSSTALFNPSASNMTYNRVLDLRSSIEQGLPTIVVGTPFLLNWTEPVFYNDLGFAKLVSTSSALVYDTTSGDLTFNVQSDVQVELTFTVTPDPTWLSGQISLVYTTAVDLYTTNIVSQETLSDNMFNNTQSYIPLAPAVITNPYTYSVWNLPAGWPSVGTYQKLKELYQLVSSGLAGDAEFEILSTDLHISVADFNRMMVLLSGLENYNAAMYTAPRPTQEELYEMTSIMRVCGRTQINEAWVVEEINYIETGTDPIELKLSGQYFWKALTEPAFGSWDPSLQTIPVDMAHISNNNVPIIDPQLLSRDELCVNPEALIYRNLYDARQAALDAKTATYTGWLTPYDFIGFNKILNEINTGSSGTAYNILPYASLNAIVNDLIGSDPFKQKEATDKVYSAFGMTSEDFLDMMAIKILYENPDASLQPTLVQLNKAVSLLLKGYKVKRLYFVSGGWIEQEVLGTFTGGSGVMLHYYNVRKMRMAPARGNVDNRMEWQRTLDGWNRQPFIQPDLVPPENIKNFVSSNWVYTAWNARKIALDAAYTSITTLFNPSSNVGVLLTQLKNQLNLIVARTSDFTFIALDYLSYFDEIKTIEDNGDDIRPNLEQLGISPAEYRVLRNVYDVLLSEYAIDPSASSSLVASDYQDVTDILIHIRSKNLPFAQVVEEYDHNIILDQDYFIDYKPALVNFPLSDLPVYNPWRSPDRDRKEWRDTLQGRIDMEQGVTDRWEEVLKEAEDRNMPLMRDALIRALTADCESWQDKAESLAKTYFIETKDNCCVKHTRVSFAIETMQGFLLALQNGIYDGFISSFSLIAPSFVQEWEWLGSYATWRAAIFVYMYPENLLYPTLKKLQSPAFIKLADTVQNANRFSGKDACEAANEYSTYLEDIKDLEILCSVNGRANISMEETDPCCATLPVGMPWVTFYFGQGKSGTSYWSNKLTNDNTKDAHSFWQELPVRKDAKLIGCFISGKRGGVVWAPFEMSLLLFYSFSDKGKFTVAYIKKDIYDPKSSWSDETETDEIPGIDMRYKVAVTACQNAMDWIVPTFSISHEGGGFFLQSIRNYNQYTDKWETPTYRVTTTQTLGHSLPWNPNANTITVTNSNDIEYALTSGTFLPITCIRFNLGGNTSVPPLTAFAQVFKDEIIIRAYGDSCATTIVNNIPLSNIIGAVECMDDINTILVYYKATNGLVKVKKVTINIGPLIGSQVFISATTSNELSQLSTLIGSVTKICPVFNESSAPILYAFHAFSDYRWISGSVSTNSTQIDLRNGFALTPDNSNVIPIQSAECINDMNQRSLDVKTEIMANLNSPQGNSLNTILRTTAVKELLYEAYYFVPMLLALDQQKRGEYTTALNWYRSVYDYTLSVINNRKIFYGLKLEESITNVYTHTSNWLLDPLNPHLVAQSRANAYTQYTLINIVQCLFSYADREFTMDTIETVPIARRIYTEALELLKVKELSRKPNGCDATAIACLRTKVDLSASVKWGNLFGSLQQKLRSLGKVSLIESIETDIVDLLNSGTEDTLPEKFSDAFQLIDDTRPAPSTPKTVTQGMQDGVKNATYAFSYLQALDDYSEFTSQVERNFTNTVMTISGVQEDELETPDGENRIAWLAAELPDNATAYDFRFANTDGFQQMRGDAAYNPLNPTPYAWKANAIYTNANPIEAHAQWPMPVTWVPLVDYAFCLPKNPVYDSLTLKGNVELYKIFNCRNIAGMVRELDAYAAATDSVTGMPFIGASGNLVTPGIGNFTPSQYRFRTLMERAKQIAAQAQQMESLFLSALEKEDAENYSQLRAKQDLQTAKATVKLQDLRINQANDERGVAEIQLSKATFTQQHYEQLLSAGMNAYEIASLILMQAAVVSEGVAAAAKFSGALTDFSDYGNGLSSLTQVLSIQANVISQLASYQRRSEEWGFQKDLAGFDVSLANQQIKVSEDNIRIVTQERDIAQMNTDHAQDSLEFLKTKFTNAELYNYMGNVLERSYSYMLNLATAIARTAERQLYFERQEQAGPFILDDYWETPSAGSIAGSGNSPDRRGLTGSARLLVDITRLDQYAFDTNKRKLQMTKVISLAQNFPSEFQEFKETGVLNFALTNKLFDYDFPGHYLRLINSVKTTVVGLLPVYDGIKATLTAGATSYTVIGGTIFQRTPIRRGSTDSVALTSPNNATGMFELQPAQNELLNPFEAMGIESQWEFKMPKFSNRIDYSNIADVLFTVEYTALDSFEYRTQVLQDLDNSLSFNRGFSFKNNFPDQWYELADVQQGVAHSNFSVTIELTRDMFPQGISNLKLNQATGVLLYFVREDGYTDEIEVADFNLATAAAAGPGGDTVNGVFRASNTVNASATPLLKLKLSFENTAVNRELFSEGHVTDIMLLVGCKAELIAFPL